MKPRTLSERTFEVINIVFLAVVSLITLYPLLYVLFASFSMPTEFIKHTGILLKPVGFSLEAYKAVFEKEEVFIGYGNTIFYVIVGTAVNMIMTITLAYVLSRKTYWGKAMMIMVVFTMYFSGGLIPTYLIVQKLGLTDTRAALILPNAITTFNLIIMKNSFEGVPVSLEEAAKIDGASPLGIMIKIILPLSTASIAVIVLYYAVGHWNGWFNAMIYLRNQNLYPLQLFLREILITQEQQDMVIGASSGEKLALSEVVKYATIIVSVVPILILYPFLQKYFTKGVLVGAVKG